MLKVTTDSNHDLPIAPNLLNRKFTMTKPNAAWVVDITCIATDEAGVIADTPRVASALILVRGARAALSTQSRNVGFSSKQK